MTLSTLLSSSACVFLTGTTHEQSYSTASSTPKKVTSSEWQVQNKPEKSQNYGGSYTTKQNYADSAATTSAGSNQGYAAAAQSFGGSTSGTTTASASSSSYSGLLNFLIVLFFQVEQI